MYVVGVQWCPHLLQPIWGGCCQYQGTHWTFIENGCFSLLMYSRNIPLAMVCGTKAKLVNNVQCFMAPPPSVWGSGAHWYRHAGNPVWGGCFQYLKRQLAFMCSEYSGVIPPEQEYERNMLGIFSSRHWLAVVVVTVPRATQHIPGIFFSSRGNICRWGGRWYRIFWEYSLQALRVSSDV